MRATDSWNACFLCARDQTNRDSFSEIVSLFFPCILDNFGCSIVIELCSSDMSGAQEILGNSLQFASDELLSQPSENALKAMLFLEFLSLLSP